MFVNLTPHWVHFLGGPPDAPLSLPPAKRPARTRRRQVVLPPVEGFPTFSNRESTLVSGLPAEEPGVWYVVSRIVLDARPERVDLLCPEFLVRDSKGAIIGCRAFRRNNPSDVAVQTRSGPVPRLDGRGRRR